jgi:hypothetical protein
LFNQKPRQTYQEAWRVFHSLESLRASQSIIHSIKAPALTALLHQSSILGSLPLAMDSALFTPEQEEIILGNPLKNVIDVNRLGLPKDPSSFGQDGQDIDEGT